MFFVPASFLSRPICSLALAAARADAEKVQLLLDARANPDGDFPANGLFAAPGAAVAMQASSPAVPLVSPWPESMASPLFAAADASCTRAVQALLQGRADVNHGDVRDRSTPLLAAVRRGRMQTALALLEAAADPNLDQHPSAVTPLLVAAQDGSSIIVQRLLEATAQVDQPSRHGVTPLIAAVSQGHAFTVQALLSARAQCNVGRPAAVHIAVRNHSQPILQVLLQARASINSVDPRTGMTPLSHAAAEGSASLVELLLTSKAVPDSGEVADGSLSAAAREGHSVIVRLLLAHQACANKRTADGVTPLYEAIKYYPVDAARVLDEMRPPRQRVARVLQLLLSWDGHDDVVSMLLEKMADPNMPSLRAATRAGCTQSGRTALHVAASLGSFRLARSLLLRRADVNQDDFGSSPALLLAVGQGHIQLVELLLDNAANINHARATGTSALLTAVSRGHADLTQLLLRRRANTDQRNSSGYTALRMALQEQHVSVIELLLAGSADVNIPDDHGLTPLFEAASQHSVSSVMALLRCSSNVNHAQQDGMTPLFFAASAGALKVSKVLLAHRACVNWVTGHGSTALVEAARRGNADMVEMLLQVPGLDFSATGPHASAVESAQAHGHSVVAALLASATAKRSQAPQQSAAPALCIIDDE